MPYTMRWLPLALTLCLFAPAASWSASIDLLGAAGAPGAHAVGADAAGDGGDGESVSATADGADPINEATAIAGAGGTGGSNEDEGPAGTGGDGGSATATAMSWSDTDAVRATTLARGGTAGSGGRDGSVPDPTDPYGYIPYYAPYGVTGVAEAQSRAESTSEDAEASAQALGRDALARADAISALGGSDSDATASGSDASATSNATSGSADADSVATSTGSNARAISNSASESANARSAASATGFHARATSDARSGSANASALAQATGGGNASDSVPTADATATSLGAGTADATAIATGSTATLSSDASVGGASRATAQAFSESGAATARATQIAGPAPPHGEDPGGFGTYGGGPGVSSVAVNLVRGSTSGLLTLEQTAIASNAGNAYDGGDATSALTRTNPGGGDLRAESSAIGGAGGLYCFTRLFPITCRAGEGGDALASVTAAGPFAAAIDARAHASSGLGAFNEWEEGSAGSGARALGGNATANAIASGGHALFSHADASGQIGAPAQATANALGAGGVFSARASVTSDAGSVLLDRYTDGVQSLVAQAGIRAPTLVPDLAPLPDEVAHARIFARPLDADVAAWLEGNPNATAALGDRDVLALGSLGAAAPMPSPYVVLPFGLSGSVSLDLAESYFGADDTLALALLDPTGSFVDAILHLSLERNGQVLFEQTLAGDVAGLDDVVVELGEIVAPNEEVASYTLECQLDLADYASAPIGFTLDFAFLGPAPVPEPGAAALVILAGVALAVRRRSAR